MEEGTPRESVSRLKGVSYPLPGTGAERETIDWFLAVNAGRKVVVVQGLGFVGAVMVLVCANTAGEEYAVLGVDLACPEAWWRIRSLNDGTFSLTTGDPKIEEFFAVARCNNRFLGTHDPYAYSKADVIVVDINLDVKKSDDGSDRGRQSHAPSSGGGDSSEYDTRPTHTGLARTRRGGPARLRLEQRELCRGHRPLRRAGPHAGDCAPRDRRHPASAVVGDLSVVGPRPMVPKTLAAYPPAAQEILNTVRPGLTGVVSIVFRDEESLLDGRPDPAAFYRNEIIPYKAALECWYVDYQGLRTYAEVIALTLWAVIFKNTRLPWRIWKNLPEPPAVLRRTEGD